MSEQSYTFLAIALTVISLFAVGCVIAVIVFMARFTKYRNEAKNAKEHAIAMLDGEERERRRLARELHDGAGHLLSLTKLRLSSFSEFIELHHPDSVTDYQESLTTFDHAVSEIRSVSQRLTPSALYEFGLASALRQLVYITQTAAGLPIDLQIRGLDENIRLTEQVEIGIYRIIQEILHNTMKHAQAKLLTLDISFDSTFIHIMTEDDGIGMSVKKRQSLTTSVGSGIEGIYHRTKLLDGNADLDSTIGHGTIWIITIPASLSQSSQHLTTPK